METKKIKDVNLGDFTYQEYEVDSNGRKQGRYFKKTYLTHEVLIDCFYRDDKLHGLYREYEFNSTTKKYEIKVKRVYTDGIDISPKKEVEDEPIKYYSGNYTFTSGSTITTSYYGGSFNYVS